MESHRLVLSVVVLTVIIAALFLGKPSITGFVSTETYTQPLDIDVFESQRFVLSSQSGDLLKLSSFSIAGTVTGNGVVNVYLTDGVRKWLVFANRRKAGSSMEQITGMAVSELNIEPSEKLNRIETLPEGYEARSGAFQNECLETCVLDEEMFNKPELYLDVIIEPGTSLYISEIRYSAMSES
jgi:hypothetical protein